MRLLLLSQNSIQVVGEWVRQNCMDLLLLVTGVLLGYGSLVHILGTRPIVLLSGGVIMVVAIISGIITQIRHSQKLRQRSRAQTQGQTLTNILDSQTFVQELRRIATGVPSGAKDQWQMVESELHAIYRMAQHIAQQESLFLADVLETLHTVLALAEQFAQALDVNDRVATPRYQQLAQSQLTQRRTRLRQTHDQLRELHDQIALVGLDQTPSLESGISERLQFIIAANESTIETHV